MIYYLAVLLFLTVRFDASKGIPGDCDWSDTARVNRCQFFCGFQTPYSYCHDNICCCGYQDGNVWQAFRNNEKGGCRDDDTTVTSLDICVGSECNAACGGNNEFLCQQNYCYCVVPGREGGTAHVFKYRNDTANDN